MPHLPSRKSLENMKRVDLQRICKEYGVKANLKSEALIDLLLDTQSPRVPPPVPAPPTTRRSSSTTKISTKAGPSRISSMIVHDTDEEADDESAKIPEESPPEEPLVPPPVPPPRTRKGKELQMRLGVGKPVIAGGQGARAVTRSSGSLKRTKSSRTIRPREVAIPEESEVPDETLDTFDSNWKTDPAVAGPSQQPSGPVAGSSMDINQLIRAAVAPLEEQIRQLKAEVAVTGEIKNELQSIKTQLAHAANAREGLAVRLDGLAEVANLVASLQEDMSELKVAVEGGTPPRPSTPKGKNPKFGTLGFGLPSSLRPSGHPPPAFEPPGTPTQPTTSSRPKKSSTTLGKRPREATTNLQANLATEDGTIAQGHSRKRPKLLVDHSTPAAPSGRVRTAEALAEGPDVAAPGNNGSAAAFTVYTDGSNPSDFLANTSDLPDFFRESSPVPGPSNGRGTRGASGAPITSTAHAIENQAASFTFPFPPIQSYPNFPFADEGGSPSPLPHSDHGIGDERGLIFKATGFSTTSTTRPRYASVEGRSVDPSSLSLTRDQQHGSSGASRPNHADGAIGLDQPVETEGSTRKTMYGTELESDTRFGDFGMDGVASGYWNYT